jgi:hypothetical protein
MNQIRTSVFSLRHTSKPKESGARSTADSSARPFFRSYSAYLLDFPVLRGLA